MLRIPVNFSHRLRLLNGDSSIASVEERGSIARASRNTGLGAEDTPLRLVSASSNRELTVYGIDDNSSGLMTGIDGAKDFPLCSLPHRQKGSPLPAENIAVQGGSDPPAATLVIIRKRWNGAKIFVDCAKIAIRLKSE